MQPNTARFEANLGLLAVLLSIFANTASGGTITYSTETVNGISDPVVLSFSDSYARILLSPDRTSVVALSAGGVDIAAPTNSSLISPTSHSSAPACYERAQRFPAGDGARPELQFTHDGIGCNTVAGRFRIWDLTIDPDSGDLVSAAVDFAQHCDGDAAVTRGALRINSNQAVQLSTIDPVFDVSGSFGFISTGWDYVAQGQNFSSTFDRFHGGVGSSSGAITASGSTGAGWKVDFASGGVSPLTPGNYENAERYPFETDGRPGLDFNYSDRGCDNISGSFAVSEIAFDPIDGAPTRFGATFTQSCETFGQPVLGTIQVRQDFQNGPYVDDIVSHSNFETTPTWPLVWRCDFR